MSSPEDKKGQARFSRRTVIIVLGLVAAVAVLASVVFFLLRTTKLGDPVALKIGEHSVTESQLAKYTASGKAAGVSAQDVRSTVIDYEKNIQLAEKHNITVPEVFISQGLAARATENVDADSYVQLVGYNRAFEVRLAQLPLAGYGVVVYEFPAQALTESSDQNLARAKAVAAQYRSQITDFNQSSSSVLRQVLQYNADNGQTANSGIRFVSSDVLIDDSATGSLMSDAYILNQVKGKKIGLTEVQQSGANSAFFLDILFDQKKQSEILSTIQQDKESIRVVEYDV